MRCARFLPPGLLKYGIRVTLCHVGKQHLHLYCDEFAFRWMHRTVTDGERAELALKQAPSARLTYYDVAG